MITVKNNSMRSFLCNLVAMRQMKTKLRCLKPHRPYTVDFAIDARERVNPNTSMLFASAMIEVKHHAGLHIMNLECSLLPDLKRRLGIRRKLTPQPQSRLDEKNHLHCTNVADYILILSPPNLTFLAARSAICMLSALNETPSARATLVGWQLLAQAIHDYVPIRKGKCPQRLRPVNGYRCWVE